MNASYIYIAIAVVTLAIVAALLFTANRNRRPNRFTPLAGLALGCVAAGLLGVHWLIGFGLMGIGVVLAVLGTFDWSRARPG